MFWQHLGNLKRVEFKIHQQIYGENVKKDRTQRVRLPFAVSVQVLDGRHQRAGQEDQNLWSYARKCVQANSKVSEIEFSQSLCDCYNNCIKEEHLILHL